MSTKSPNLNAATFGAAPPQLTLATLDAIAATVRNMPPEPIGEWMREQGHPPEQWAMVLPESMRAERSAPLFWPIYVMFSRVAETPMFVRRGTLTH